MFLFETEWQRCNYHPSEIGDNHRALFIYLLSTYWDFYLAAIEMDAMRKAPLMLSPAIAPKLHRRCTGNAPELHRGLIVEGAAGGRQGALECVRLDWLFSLAALKLPCNCPETALQLPWKCPESALKVPWNYPETTLKLPWNCTETDLKLHWNCTETALKLHWAIAETAANQHRDGGFNLRVNGCRGRWRWHRAHPA